LPFLFLFSLGCLRVPRHLRSPPAWVSLVMCAVPCPFFPRTAFRTPSLPSCVEYSAPCRLKTAEPPLSPSPFPSRSPAKSFSLSLASHPLFPHPHRQDLFPLLFPISPGSLFSQLRLSPLSLRRPLRLEYNVRRPACRRRLPLRREPPLPTHGVLQTIQPFQFLNLFSAPHPGNEAT